MNQQSYIEVETDRLIELATNTLVEIEEARKARSERYLEARAARSRRSRLRRFCRFVFRQREPTAEGLRQQFEKLRGSYYVPYHWYAGLFLDEEETARRLFHLAFYDRTGKVYLTAADLAVLLKQYPKELA